VLITPEKRKQIIKERCFDTYKSFHKKVKIIIGIIITNLGQIDALYILPVKERYLF